jgi:hypothetical protein
MYSRFVVGADARELVALHRVAGALAGKLARDVVAGLWTEVRGRARRLWIGLREDAERGARGWR